MVTVVAEHWLNAGQADTMKRIFMEVSESARKAPGFVSRVILSSQKDSTKFTTITSWESQEAFDKWREIRSFSFGSDLIHQAFSKEVVDIYNLTEEV